jgi:uncharacterized membrane protein YhaH (DUF805 family)
MKWYLKALKKYATFEGRAQRAEYWYSVLFSIIFAFSIYITLSIIMTFSIAALGTQHKGILFFFFPLALLSGLFICLVMVAVTARRLHDINFSGWWQIIFYIPLIGLILSIVLLVQDSTPGNNKYGANPKITG